jgi:curved DNA-binding protein CbpA
MASGKNKRRFKRYPLTSECFISFEEQSFRGRSTDYSLKGIGFSVDGSPPFTAGSNIRIRIEALGLDEEGIITWSRKTGNYVRGGCQKKSISGRLKNFPVADVLIDLQRGLKNGILVLSNGSATKKIYIRTGDIVYATSNTAEDGLIEIVLRAGKITSDQHRQLYDISQKKEKTHAAMLVELGYLKPEDIIWSVKKQVEEIILSIFRWEDGSFAFFESPRLSDKVITLKLSTANIIYRGVKGIDDIASITNTLPPLNTVLRYSTDPMDLFQDLSIDAADNDVLSLVDGKRTLKEILSLSPFDHFQTMVSLAALLSTRILYISAQKSDQEGIHEDLLKESSPEIDTAFIERVDSLYSRLSGIDHYSFLRIEKGATPEAIRKAYYTAAKEYHPDKHLQLPSLDLKNKLNIIFSRLTEVYRTLSNPKARALYDGKFSSASPPAQQNTAELAKTRYAQGEEAFKRRAYAEARELFGQAIYLDNSVAAYYFRLGRVLMHEHKFREAGKMLNQALTLDPYNADFLAELGHIYLSLGFHLRAKSAFEKAIKSDPHNTRAITGLHLLQNYSGS